ncbi:hypothetical protein ACT1U9_31370 [Streptomyces sp. BR1]|uniref:hypothetical protein n=1 Tax=Streptomyces sp. BR1 TaxID=1592323 RepID=UPI00402B72ED
MSLFRPMSISGPSRSRRARTAVVGAVLAAALTLAGCQDGTDPKASSPAVSSPAPVSSSAAPVTTPADSPTPSPTPSRTSAKPHTLAPAPPKSHTPIAPAPSTKATGSGDCEIVSNAGNCYNAGQFCRKADLGRSTHAANGREIYCRIVSGRPHWQY